MVLVGKLITELGIKTPVEKFFKLFSSELHEVQNVCERIHHGKLHEGHDDWHHNDSVKQWTIVIDGKVNTCNERIEVDDQNKKITYKLFGGNLENYKLFNVILEVINKTDGSSAVRWTIDYEKNNEDVDTPNGWMDYLSKCTTDADAHLLKGEKVAL